MLPVSLRLESILNFGRYGDERGEVEDKWEGWITMTDPVLTFCKGVLWLSPDTHVPGGSSQFLGSCYRRGSKQTPVGRIDTKWFATLHLNTGPTNPAFEVAAAQMDLGGTGSS